jgi:hypothetical protein
VPKRNLKDKPLGKMQFIVKDCVFNRTVHVLLNYSADDFTKWAQAKGDKSYQKDERGDANMYAFSSQMDTPGEQTEWIICMKSFNWTIRDQGSLIHEIVHTVMKIFAMNNIPFVLETQEFCAQIIGNMYEDIAAVIHRKNLALR